MINMMAEKKSRKIRILMAGFHPPPPGGMANCILNLEMSKLKDDFEIRAFDTDYPRPLKRLRPFTILWLPVMYLQFASVLSRFKPDIVHVHTPSFVSFFKHALFVSMSRNRGIPAILHVHGGKFQNFYESLSAWCQERVRRRLNLADRVIVLSDGWREFFRNLVPQEKIRIVENGIPLDKFTQRENPLFKTGNSFIYVGMISSEKGLSELIEAYAIVEKEVPGSSLTIVGSGKIDEYKRMAESYGILEKVRFTGTKVGQSLLDLYASSDIFVLPSHYEGMPLVLLEAMAMKLAVIATDVGAIPEVLGTSGGIIIPPRDVDALRKAMMSLVGNNEVINKMGIENRKTIERRFSFDRVAEDIGRIYREFVRKS